MSEQSEWNDPPGVNLDGTVENTTTDPDPEPTAERSRGPFAGLRRVLGWVFWGGFVLAAVGGALGAAGPLPPLAGALKLTLAFAVTIGWWVGAGWWLLWALDKVLVFLKS